MATLTDLQLETVPVVVADPRVAREDVGRLVLLMPHHRAAAVQEVLADLWRQERRRVNVGNTTMEQRETATETTAPVLLSYVESDDDDEDHKDNDEYDEDECM